MTVLDRPQVAFDRPSPEAFFIDMDGVLVREGHPLPGSAEFVHRLRDVGKRFLVLINNSIFPPRDRRARRRLAGIDPSADAV